MANTSGVNIKSMFDNLISLHKENSFILKLFEEPSIANNICLFVHTVEPVYNNEYVKFSATAYYSLYSGFSMDINQKVLKNEKAKIIYGAKSVISGNFSTIKELVFEVSAEGTLAFEYLDSKWQSSDVVKSVHGAINNTEYEVDN